MTKGHTDLKRCDCHFWFQMLLSSKVGSKKCQMVIEDNPTFPSPPTLS